MWWFIVSICLGVWTVLDAKRRRENKMLMPYLVFILGPIIIPVYMAKRNLKENEIREGGTGWNILKNFALYWTITCAVWACSALFFVGSVETSNEYEAAGAAIGAGLGIIMIGTIWFIISISALILGFFLKKSSIVEKGPTGELLDQTPAEYSLKTLFEEGIGFLRHQSESSITTDREVNEAFPAVIKAGNTIGKVKEENRLAGYVVIRIGMKLFPPQNPATVRVALKRNEDSQTEISFSSDSFDGGVGFGSAGKAIDQIIKALEKTL